MGSAQSIKALQKMFESIQITGGIPEDVLSKISTQCIVFGILAMALCIFVGFATKKGKVIGILAGLANLISAIMIPKFVGGWHTIKLFQYREFVGSNMSDAQAQADAWMAEANKQMVLDFIPIMISFALMLLAFILTLVLIFKVLKCKPKVLGIFALLLQIGRYLFISPLPMFFMFGLVRVSYKTLGLDVPALGEQLTRDEMIAQQVSQVTTYNLSILLPLLLIAIVAVICLVKKNKVEAPAVEVEAPVVETPVAEAPVAEAPEAVEAEAPATEEVAEEPKTEE